MVGPVQGFVGHSREEGDEPFLGVFVIEGENEIWKKRGKGNTRETTMLETVKREDNIRTLNEPEIYFGNIMTASGEQISWWVGKGE